MMQLDAEEKIVCSGCFLRPQGSPLWACADCRHEIEDGGFVMQADHDSSVMRKYHSALDEIFAYYRPLSEEGYLAVEGRALFKSCFRKAFQQGATEGCLQREGAGFVVGVRESPQSEWSFRREPHFFEQLFDRAVTFYERQIRESGAASLTMRIKGQDEVFAVQREQVGDMERLTIRRL